jgi:hypothetical protein
VRTVCRLSVKIRAMSFTVITSPGSTCAYLIAVSELRRCVGSHRRLSLKPASSGHVKPVVAGTTVLCAGSSTSA